MTYSVKEIFYTLQGEGANAGRAAVFLRFSGCNLWSGLERDRESAVCKFCDTDFVGIGTDGGKFRTAEALVNAVINSWPRGICGNKLVVCTGGEPLLQLDVALISELKANGFEVAVETNGTIPAPPGIDWLCVSPKAGSELKLFVADELKLVFPQVDAMPDCFTGFQANSFLLQPMDGAGFDANMRAAIQYCLNNPRWKLSVQVSQDYRDPLAEFFTETIKGL